MTSDDTTPLPVPAFAGGTRAITTTPVVGAPRREYAETFVPGEEELEDGEIRVTVLGSGNPWVTRGPVLRQRAGRDRQRRARPASSSTSAAARSRTTRA